MHGEEKVWNRELAANQSDTWHVMGHTKRAPCVDLISLKPWRQWKLLGFGSKIRPAVEQQNQISELSDCMTLTPCFPNSHSLFLPIHTRRAPKRKVKLLPWLSLFLSSQEFFLEQVLDGTLISLRLVQWWERLVEFGVPLPFIFLIFLPSLPDPNLAWYRLQNKDWSSNGRMRNKQQAHSNLAELDLIAPCFVCFFMLHLFHYRKSCLYMYFENALFGNGWFCLGGKIKWLPPKSDRRISNVWRIIESTWTSPIIWSTSTTDMRSISWSPRL